MNENQVGAKHLVMIITNEVFCNRLWLPPSRQKEKFSQASKKYLLGLVMLMELTAVTIQKMG